MTAADGRYMERALELAARGRYGTHPNPRVGCVLVRDGQVVGEGWHRRAGSPHAEIEALGAAGEQARGACCYVTLEPCHHHGHTPPCDQALAAAGVARVVAALADPDPRVNGQGLRALHTVGVQTTTGLCAPAARELNRGYFKRLEERRPYVSCKLAMSLDGRTAAADGTSQWISAPESRADVQRLRAESSAILTSAATVLADDPRLTVRGPDTAGRQPLRVVLDPEARVSAAARLFQEPGESLVIGKPGPALPNARRHYATGRDLAAVLEHLAVAEQVNELLIESGPRLAGAFLQAGLLDRLYVYLAPCLLGPGAAPLLQLDGISTMAGRIQLRLEAVHTVGPDLRLDLVPG